MAGKVRLHRRLVRVSGKGESLVDTLNTLAAMRPDAIVMRHSASGAPHFLARHLPTPIINAGDGTHEHPTQALLDARTILDRIGHLEGLRVAIIGDIAHSRVARSNIWVLLKLGARVCKWFVEFRGTRHADGGGAKTTENPDPPSHTESGAPSVVLRVE